jgi:serine/threonine protein kinase
MQQKIPTEFKLSQTETIYQSKNSHIYIGEYNKKKAVLKIFPDEYPSETIQHSYQRDYNIGALLYEKYPDHYSQPLKLIQEPNRLIVIKTHEGISLSDELETIKRFDIETFLDVAIQICENVQLIHSENILHCDLKPHNILWNQKRCTVIDFESSFLVSLKNSQVSNALRGKKLLKMNICKGHICT